MSTIQGICLAIVFLPLLAGVVSGLFGKLLGRQLTHCLAISSVGLSSLFSIYLLTQLYCDKLEPIHFTLYEWAKSGSLTFHIGFLVDRLSVLMMCVVSFVSCMVHIYTVGYMKEDPGYQRFFSYIALFTFGMLMLVMSDNFLQLFFGWEMVGLMSYLLIGFWFYKPTAIFASLKAFLVNRLGDFGFLIGIAAVAYYFGSLTYADVFTKVESVSSATIALSDQMSLSVITLICLALFVGAMGKSAQMPLHIWLPDSMEGPTPISALIHAATMVTAGVFMLARLSPLYEYTETALNVVLVIGSLTCLLMGLVGIVQNDIKRIVAYSTLSQLGYMMMAMGVSAYPIGIFHLMTHAFFKALLFLGAGSVIIALHHEQDIWKMGNLKRYMPITYFTMLIGSLALVGFPLFSGFYSKDLIIEAIKYSKLPMAGFAYWVGLSGVLITTLYTFRLIFVAFHTKERMGIKAKRNLHESPAVVCIPLLLLALPALLSGAIFVKPLFNGFFGNTLYIHPDHTSFELLSRHFHGALSMGLWGFFSIPFLLNLVGIVGCWLAYVYSPKLSGLLKARLNWLYRILWNKFGFDIFNEKIVIPSVQQIGRFFWHFGDQDCIDGVMVNGTASLIERLSMQVRRFQTGYLYHYAFVMVLGFLFLVGWLMLSNCY